MNRRRAIKNLTVLGIFTSIGFGGYKIYSIRKNPSLFLLNDYKLLIAELAETIIPTTDTAGAKACKVEDFIINVVKNCTSKEDQNNFIAGLQKVEEYCEKNYQTNFAQCNTDQKIETLSHLEQRDVYKINFVNKVNRKFFGQAFFIQLKALTVQGYCMSFLGATKGLAYDYVPGSYQSCIALTPGQKSWATK